MDSAMSLTLLLWDVFFSRLSLFLPPLCDIIGPLFYEPSLFLKFYYWSYNHARLAKSVSQILMVLNRMSCVIWPLSYEKIWDRYSFCGTLMILILPFGGTWNILLSRMFAFSLYGGFSVTYVKYISWASLSGFQLVYIFTALGFTVTCTIITMRKLIVLPGRIKDVEKSLCLGSIFYSVAFLIVAGLQLIFAVCSTRCYKYSFLTIVQFLAFDVLTIGSAIIMILTSSKLAGKLRCFKRTTIFHSRSNPFFQSNQSHSINNHV